jgi:hypothetical protein
MVIPRLRSKIDEALRLPHLSDFHAVEVRAFAERIESLFLSIRDTVDDTLRAADHPCRSVPSRNRTCRNRSRPTAQVRRIVLKRLHFLQPAMRTRA